MKGLLLGLASGANCLGACAPLLLSLLTAHAGTHRNRYGLFGCFLLGRAVAYAGLGALAWRFGATLQQWPRWHAPVLGFALILGAVLLLVYGFGAGPLENQGLGRSPACANRRSYRTPGLALAGGVVTGLSPCAPLLLAFAAAAESRTLLDATAFFLCFFAGTAVYLLPLPLLGFLGRWPSARVVARLAVGLIGAYYLYAGLFLAIQGMR